MNLCTLLLIVTYTTIVVSLIWARFRFFNIQSSSSRFGSRLYDPVVTINFALTYFFFITETKSVLVSKLACLIFYLVGLGVFWWSIFTAKELDFAFSHRTGIIVTSGPYSWVRHPIYLSYIFIWLGSTILFNSILFWVTLVYLVTFYITSALTEEKVLLSGGYTREYQTYSQKVGMFLPRITLWKR